MKAVIQRVKNASCVVSGSVSGSCSEGLMILLGVRQNDTEEDARLLAEKIAKLRIFKDENDKMNLSVLDIGGEILVISNFTLCANYKHGNRPEYLDAMEPGRAEKLYEYFVSLLRMRVKHVGTGIFGEEMHINMELNGPVTIVMESDVLKKNQNKS